MFSLASIATMAACIFLFGIFFCVVENFQYMVREMEKSVAVTVFFDEGLSQEQIDAIGDQIRARDEVSNVVFVTAEEAWDEYKEIYFEEAPQLAEGFENDNPLANEAHYEIYLKNVESQDDLVTWLESVDGIRRINKSAQVADILTNFNMLVGYISIAVKAPFVVEGIIIGLIGASIPLALLYFLYTKLINFMGDKFNILTGLLQFLPVGEMFRILLPVGLALGVGIGFFGSFFTIRKHLRV